MRTITNLYKEADTVFIRFENEAVGKRFLQDAEREGFLINGKKLPTKGSPNEVYMLDENFGIHPISGFAIYMFYYSGISINDGKTVVRINYGKYINNDDDYIIKGKPNSKLKSNHKLYP